MVERPHILTSRAVDFVDIDCACPTPGLTHTYSAEFTAAHVWQSVPDRYHLQLPNRHELVCSPAAGADIAVLNASAVALLKSFDTPRPLDPGPGMPMPTDPGIPSTLAHMVATRLLCPVGTPNQPVRSVPQTLTAWLHLTSACPLRCTYCYVPKTSETMDVATGRTTIATLFRTAEQHGITRIVLKYAGGEPALCFSLIRQLQDYAGELADATGIALHAVMLSSGVGLQPAMFEYMRDMSIRLVLSLDGIGTTHDAQRPFHHGHGSFAEVCRSVDYALAAGLQPGLSITVTDQNVDTLCETVTVALERGLPFHLNLYRNHQQSPPKHQISLLTNQPRVIAGIQAVLNLIETRLPDQRIIDGLLDRTIFGQPQTHTCGAGHNYLVIDQRGHISRCHMDMAHPLTDLHADDPLQVIQTDTTDSLNIEVDAKDGCQDCLWRYWCAGGCPLSTFHTTGTAAMKSPYCQIYRALYPAILRLEGLRLLKGGRSE